MPHVAYTNHQRPSVMQDDGPKEEPLYWPSVAVDSNAAAASGHATIQFLTARARRSLPSFNDRALDHGVIMEFLIEANWLP